MNGPIWDEGGWVPLPGLQGNVRTDVCVIGLGASGLAAVEELAALGVNVVGLDAGPVGAGAAGRNGGLVLAGLARHFNEAVVDYGEAAASALYRLTVAEIEREVLAFPGTVRRTGVLRLAAGEAEREACRKHLAALRYGGFPGEPYVGPEGEGVLVPTDGVMQPLRRVREHARRLLANQQRLYEGSEVRRLVPGSVVTDEGTVYCDSVLVAVDGRLERLLPELSGRVRTARLQMLATAPAPAVPPLRAAYWRDGFEYWQQLPDGSVALGGFRDRALENEWTPSDLPTGEIQQALEQFLRTHLLVTSPVTHRWAASAGYTSDGLPLIEEVRPKVWAAGGYCGAGNIVGVLSGRAAARRICGQRSGWLEAIDAARAKVLRPPRG